MKSTSVRRFAKTSCNIEVRLTAVFSRLRISMAQISSNSSVTPSLAAAATASRPSPCINSSAGGLSRVAPLRMPVRAVTVLSMALMASFVQIAGRGSATTAAFSPAVPSNSAIQSALPCAVQGPRVMSPSPPQQTVPGFRLKAPQVVTPAATRAGPNISARLSALPSPFCRVSTMPSSFSRRFRGCSVAVS